MHESNPPPASPIDQPQRRRRQKLDEARQREVCAILAVGGTRQMAAHYVGCHVETIRRTARREPQFAQRLRRSEVGAELTLLRSIHAAAGDVRHWRAAAWALERMFPQRYARRRPDALPLERAVELIEQVVATLLKEVRVKRDRKRVLARVAQLTAGLAES
jgi:hypothetical protein